MQALLRQLWIAPKMQVWRPSLLKKFRDWKMAFRIEQRQPWAFSKSNSGQEDYRISLWWKEQRIDSTNLLRWLQMKFSTLIVKETQSQIYLDQVLLNPRLKKQLRERPYVQLNHRIMRFALNFFFSKNQPLLKIISVKRWVITWKTTAL